MGLPLHPLVIHFTVVAVPLLALAGIVYAFVPSLRARVGWIAVLLAIVTPLTVLVSKLAGDAFRARIQHKNLASPEIFAKIDAHRALGTTTLYWTIGLGVAVLLLVLLRNQARALSIALSVVTVVLALISVWYVYRTGDAGAKIVWSQY
jgi:hypothetical protein